MALTVSVLSCDGPQGGGARYRLSVTFDASYPTNGETLDLSSYLSTMDSIEIQPQGMGYKIQHDGGSVSAGKLKVFGSGASNAAIDVEVANATNLAALSCFCTISGVPA